MYQGLLNTYPAKLANSHHFSYTYIMRLPPPSALSALSSLVSPSILSQRERGLCGSYAHTDLARPYFILSLATRGCCVEVVAGALRGESDGES